MDGVDGYISIKIHTDRQKKKKNKKRTANVETGRLADKDKNTKTQAARQIINSELQDLEKNSFLWRRFRES